MDDQAQNDPLFPIAVLIDELKVNRLVISYIRHLVESRILLSMTTSSSASMPFIDFRQ